MKVLVISSKNAVAAQVQQALAANAGWDTIWATTLAEVRPELDNQTLIILDYETDPSVAEAWLKNLYEVRRFNDAPILLLGNQACEAQLKVALAKGAGDYILRPFDEKALQAKVAEMVRPVGSMQNVDVKMINPFINATTEVFDTAAQMRVKRKTIFLKKNYHMFGDISAIMGLSGKVSGAVVISMPGQLACILVGKMLGEEPSKTVDAAVRDGIGELVNMIAGHAKAALAESEYHFVLSLPVVVSGQGHEIAHKSGAPCIVVVFEAGSNEFAIQVSLASS